MISFIEQISSKQEIAMNIIIFSLTIVQVFAINPYQLSGTFHRQPITHRNTIQTNIQKHLAAHKQIVDKMCTVVTCTKCKKSFSYGSPPLYCQIILNLPNCCTKTHILYNAF